jgi:hypothetical protein
MKCLWCGESVELYDPGMYQFCDRCLANLEALCLDLDEAERKLRLYRGSQSVGNQRRLP